MQRMKLLSITFAVFLTFQSACDADWSFENDFDFGFDTPVFTDTRDFDTGYHGTGCSDGTREGFINDLDYPYIAGCAGAWTIPGIHHEEGPACARRAGNTNYQRDGYNCNVEDLCAEGWHVCYGADDVAYNTPPDLGCSHIMDGTIGPAFFLSRATSSGALICGPDGDLYTDEYNDIFGCGDLGCSPGSDKNCGVLNATSHDACAMLTHGSCHCYSNGSSVSCSGSTGCDWCHSLDYYELYYNQSIPDHNAWDCGTSANLEANDVIKRDPDYLGGVLCCMNN